MFVKPGLKSKEGLQRSGIYSLVIYLVVTTIFPDINTDQVMETANDVASWWKNGGGESGTGSVQSILDQVVKPIMALYLGNRLRNQNRGIDAKLNDRPEGVQS